MKNTALLIIDMQVCNFEGSDPVYRGSDLLSTTRKLIEKARGAGALIMYIQHCGPEGAVDHPGAPGFDIHPVVAPGENDIIVRKKHPDAFQDTNLESELESNNINHLIIAGIQTEYCVDTTCRRAYSLGYHVILVADGHSTWDTENLTAPQIIAHHNEVLGGWFTDVKTVHELCG